MTVGRAFTAAAVAAAVCLLAGGRAAAVPAPLIPPEKMLAVDEIRPGMKGVGKSVFQGTRVESFGVTVLGVLRRVDFGADLILVSIDSGPPVSRGYGVVAGMSGSPVYVGGKLIGAVAYTWAFAKRPIAGVTPIGQMLEAFQPGSSPPRRRGVLRPAQAFVLEGQRISRVVVEPSAPARRVQGELALVPVATPVLVSGVNPTTLSLLRKALEPLGLVPLTGAGAVDHVHARMEPGAAVGARLMGGDLDMTAIGTVTYVQGDVVLAFGHSLQSLGTTEMPLVAAWVHGVVPSAELSVKLASGGQVVGRITEDRAWSVGGRLGPGPRLVEAALHVRDLDREVAHDYRVEVIRNRSLTSALLTTAVAGAIDSVGVPSEGTTRVTLAVEAEGLPRLVRRNTFALEEDGGLLALLLGSSAAVMSATEELSRVLDALQNSEFGEAKLQRVAVGIELSKRRRVARLERATIAPQRVRAGEEVEITAVLRAANAGATTRVERVRIPEWCPPGRVQVGIAGGRSADWLRSRLSIADPRPQSLAQMLAQMLDRPSNDELVVQIGLPTVGIEARGQRLRDLPPAVLDVLRAVGGTKLRPLRDYTEHRTPTEWVVSGYSVATITVEGGEKDKAGRSPTPTGGPSMFEELPGGLAGLFSSLEPEAAAAGAGESDFEAGDEGKMAEDEEAPPMPSWDEVSAVGEVEVTTRAAEGERPGPPSPRGDAVGRPAMVWRLSAQKDFEQGERDGVAALSTGGLALALSPSVVGKLASQCLWPAAVAPDGSVYVGSWGDGRLYRMAADGTASVALETDDAAVQAVAVGPDGTVFAASAPSGTVWRIAPAGGPERLCRLDASNVWALARDEQGIVWAATGPQGRLYRISPRGDAEIAFVAADRHITALARGPQGTLYLATSPRGKVYALEVDGRARAVYELPNAAAQSLAVDAQGNVYVGTSPDGRVVRIEPSGAAREVLKSKGKHVLALQVAPDGMVYAAVGPQAKVYAIWPDGTWAEVYAPRGSFVAALAPDGEAKAIYLTTPDRGELARLQVQGRRSGSFQSTARDAGAGARWGAVRWHGRVPEGSAARVWTRAGDTAHPDATWTEWRPVAPGGAALAPEQRRRFLQCRVELEGEATGVPLLEAIEIAYLPANQAPEVSLSSPKGGEVWRGKQTVRWSAKDPDGDRLSYQVFWSPDQGATWIAIQAPAKPEAQPEAGKGEEGEPRPPAAGTEESADQEGKEEAEEAGKAAPTAATTLEWDTTTVADGRCWLKVVASDAAANPEEPRSGEAISRAFTVDNTPPELVLDRRRGDADPPPAGLAAYDAASFVSSAEFRVDGGEWLAASAADGIFDSGAEVIALDPARLPVGSHEVEVRGRDAAGNTAAVKLRYTR